MAWEFELIAGPYGGTTEGPAWDGEALLFTHILESRILRYDPRRGAVTEFRKYTSRTNGLAFSADGQLYGCQSGSRRIVCFNSDGSTSVLADRLDGHFHNHPNDLAVDRQGRIWFTDPFGRQPAPGPQLQGLLEHASVLRLEQRLDRNWMIRRMTYDTTSPNGILVSQDQRTLYVAQSDYGEDRKRELRAYPIREDGTLGPYAVLHTFGIDARGIHRGVDGMCFDSEGNIIACAGWQQEWTGSDALCVLALWPRPGDVPHARGPAHQLYFRRRGPAYALHYHWWWPPLPRAPYRAAGVATVSTGLIAPMSCEMCDMLWARPRRA